MSKPAHQEINSQWSCGSGHSIHRGTPEIPIFELTLSLTLAKQINPRQIIYSAVTVFFPIVRLLYGNDTLNLMTKGSLLGTPVYHVLFYLG